MDQQFTGEEMTKLALVLSRIMSEHAWAIEGYMEIDNQVSSEELTPLEGLAALRNHFFPHVLKVGQRMMTAETSQLIGVTYDEVKQEMKSVNPLI